MTRKLDDWHGCPIRYAAAMIGDRWKLVILRDLALKEARRYGDFAVEEGVATNILASRLLELESGGLIDRTIDPENGRPIYRLTEKGRDLVPALLALIAWSYKWDPKTEVPKSFARDLRRAPDKLARRIMSGLVEGTSA
ncbi:winged helix-turn-helix transcriptional regulator [Bradyrhizobium murdochi]|uniref:winged helix-turn-helix transcriptional regulator n=1 Tax=Bradyrhizobium murdochi TaxID=1038859 RepID=UPI00048A203E|nr:helix-turn-helix domain-containing protein [Bradyrhizobium murdochi]